MAYVYLIQNGDLFKIGRTEHLERRLKQLLPGKLVQAGQTDRSRDLEYELHQRFKSVRIPQTEYFRLNDYQVEQVRVALGWAKPKPLPPVSKKPHTHGCKIRESTATERHSRLKDAYLKQVEEQKDAYLEQVQKHALTGDEPDWNDWWKGGRIRSERIKKELEEQKSKDLAQRKYDKWKAKLAQKHEVKLAKRRAEEQAKEALTEPERQQIRTNMQRLSNFFDRWPNN